MNFQTHCDRYLQNIYRTQTSTEATPELSLYPHLQAFLEELLVDLGRDTVRLTQEPRQLEQIGRPDFIAMDGMLPVGYIEAEAYGRDLDALTGHAAAQNARFIENLDNFILTNFVEFRLYADGVLRATANIEDSPENLEGLLERFLDAGQVEITSPEVLARYLARRTRELQTQIATTLTDENSEIYGMFSAFKELLISTLTPDDFADMYAQTLAYGLFAARCTLPNATHFSRHTAVDALPRSNPFLVQLFHHVASPTLETNVTYILDDIAALLRNVPTEMLRTAFAARNHLEDPVIHFYETFLAEYDPQRRVDRGVYYTPPQVISYIVRSVDSLLKTDLNRPDGLADDNTLILDPATGTGGFLLTVLDQVREYVAETYGTGEWTQYVNAQLVRRIFGFELLVAPYTIAHLKLSLFLQSQGWRADERLGIYLTNTLEQPDEMQPSIPFAGFISDEANAALSVKRDEPILVILGNPPYQRHSANPSRDADGNLNFIGRLMEDYRSVDGAPMTEQNVQALQGDYVKFVRWAQWRIDRNGEGVIGYIVNHGFLYGIIFRGMRQSLMNSFNTIYCFNLHGSSRVGEIVPDGETDENVFDIQQGTAILLCVKERDNVAPAKIYYADLWGSRTEKYATLSHTDVQTTAWIELTPDSPFYHFVPRHDQHIEEYEAGWVLTDIFQASSIGIITARDRLTIHNTPEAVRATVTDFTSLSESEARQQYRLPRDRRDWQIRLAQEDLQNHPEVEQHIVPINYRPFDTRYTYYTGQSRGFHCMPRPAIMSHLLMGENLALCTHRIIRSATTWQHVFVTNRITDGNCVSNTDGPTHVFPLYLYPNPEELGISTERSLNFQPAFLTALSEALELPQTAPFNLPEGVSPEEILAYIYAVLYSPTYRERYYDFLRYDFPRIPLPQDIAQFRTLATLGQRLMDSHLLEDVPRPEGTPASHRFEGEGDGVVGRIRYLDGQVWINPTQHFTDVSEEVWEYEIGAYQVCEKWLKDRRGEVLRHEDVRRYRAILVAVAETLSVMGEIDLVLW
ncbi:N-6 DNA methylase [Candidatus Poribacteria bacterium]|nr:N-6 DNA methylase [Candidatus Poribacteria bacterium]MYG05344.1 N-6 DNA methylase [Candidatus Poribacteria bacterium]MYK24829.1 N-6 DNA methylase [Candidatus Poribacteria bacterium]